MNICLYGAANENIDQSYKTAVEALGEQMAIRGHAMIFGGGKYGIMGAAARGISRKGGKLYGVAPKFFLPDGVLFEDCTEFFYTEDMRSRKALMEQKADGFLVTPGGIGTYEEFLEIFTLVRLKQLDKPIAVFNVNGYYSPMLNLLYHTAEQGFMDKQSIDNILFSDNIDEILTFLEK